MKTRHLIIITIMLAILTLGVASAAENSDAIASENMTENPMESQADDTPLDLQNEQALQDSPGEIEMNVTDVAENVNYSKYVSCRVNIPDQNANGNLYVYVDEMQEYSYGYSVSGPVNAMFQSSNYVSDFGNHSLYVKYVDSAGRYANTTRNFTFETTDYELSLSDNYGDAICGRDYNIGVSIPFDARGTMTITHNGVEYVISPDAYYWLITIPAENLQYGRNEVKIHFSPQEGCKLPEKTVTDSFNCTAVITGPTNPVQVYGEVESVVLILPKDANDNLIVYSGGHIWRASKMSNGRAAISLKDLSCGRHIFEAAYIGSDYSAERVTFDFEVTPKVVVPNFAYRGNDTFQIQVTLPSATSGTLVVRNSFNSEEKTYQSPGGVMTINLTVPNTDTWVSVRYTQGDLRFEESYWVGARNSNPEFEMNVTVDDVIKGRDLCANIEIPSGYGLYGEEPFDGYFALFIDGVEFAKSQNPWIFYNTQQLETGMHEWRVEFLNDCYYHAEAKSGTFNVSYFKCEFYENMTLGHANVFVKTADNATGMLRLLVDGVECDSVIVTDYVTILKLPEYAATGEHEIEVIYVGNYPQISERGRVNLDYDFYVFFDSLAAYAYGQPVTITVYTYKRAEGNVSLSIGNENYTLELVNGTAQITLTGLECGQYLAVAEYAGGSGLGAKTANVTFTVGGYAVLGPEGNIIYGSDEQVSLVLPEDADGNLTVEVDDLPYSTARLENGKAVISLEGASPGSHTIHAYYTGGDYAVAPYDLDGFNVEIMVVYPNEVNADEDAWIYMLLPKDAQGKVIMNMSGEISELVHDDGVINHTFRLSKFGEYQFTLIYNATDYDIALPDGAILVKPASFTIIDDNEISFTIPADGKGMLSLYNRDELIYDENVTGPKVSILLAGLKPGRYDLKVVYEDEKYGNFTQSGIYVTVPNPVPSIAISNSGNDKRATLTFTLPNDATGGLIVKVDDTTEYVQINGGIAQLIIDNLAMGSHEVSAQYLGDENYSPAKAERTIDVASSIPARIAAKDASAVYTAGTLYSVTVYGEGGFLAKNVQVVIKINGKKVATPKTNSKGVATYKIAQKPGSYRITAQALGKTVTKKLTVKHVLKLKKVKVKRSAKKLVITASLVKVNGKYLKNKKITLKFKGKKYVAKTNKKGIAKFTIKSKVLKKLKKGKKLTYQATYLKDSVKYTVKIRK